MRPIGSKRASSLLLCAALLLAGSGPVCSPSCAQTRASGTGGRANWTPPFAPASPALLLGIKRFMLAPAGLSLASQIPSFRSVRSYSPYSPFDLRALGALGAHLPPDFEARLTAALGRPEADPHEFASLSRALGDAYNASIPEAARAVQSRARQIALAVAYGRMGGVGLIVASAELERFGVYGPRVQEKAAIVKNLAAQRAMEHEQRIAADFLRQTQSADGARAASAGETVSGASPAGDPRPMPDDWRLRAYRQAPGQKAGGAGAAARPPSPKPESNDLYERIGAAKGMPAADIRSAYLRAALLYHPDRHSNEGEAAVKRATVAFQRIQQAYEVLRDPGKRAAYDLELAKRVSPRRPPFGPKL